MITKKRVKDSIGYDNLIIQTINHIEELNKISNMLSKRLREWYSLYNPEFSNSIDDHLAFSRMILEGNEPKLKESMGADLKEEDITTIKDIAKEIVRIDELKESQIAYLEKIMKKHCPNIQAVAGTLIGGKLVAMAGSLEKLTIFPSSTVQLLGAEKALFRHIKTGSRPPKFGVIMNHQLVNSVRLKEKGKVARMLANKISLAARVDRFKGEFIGDKLAKALEDAVKKEAKK
jgi:nucleolar protein 56